MTAFISPWSRSAMGLVLAILILLVLGAAVLRGFFVEATKS
jgi:hypothetical protein